MDDFTIHDDSFDECLHHLTLVLKHSIKINLVLNLNSFISWWSKGQY